jgi:hypothetical protein
LRDGCGEIADEQKVDHQTGLSQMPFDSTFEIVILYPKLHIAISVGLIVASCSDKAAGRFYIRFMDGRNILDFECALLTNVGRGRYIDDER